MVKLQKATWRRYNSVWKALLCFVYCTQQPGRSISLRHRFTNQQLFNLGAAVRRAKG